MLKSAESPLLRAALNILGTKVLLDDQQAAGQALRDAALADLMSRQSEADKMRPMRRGLRPAGGIAPDTTDYASAGSLQDFDPELSLALPFEKGGSADPELTKEALNLMGVGKVLGGGLLRAGGAITKQVGRATGAMGQGAAGLGQKLQGPLGATQRMAQAANPAGFAAPGMQGRLGSALSSFGRGAQQAGLGMGVAGQNVAQGGRAMVAGALAPAAAPAAQAASKPLLSTGTKIKMMGTAGALGAGYLGYKGLEAARDYMSVPAGHHHQGYLKQNVNQYGY